MLINLPGPQIERLHATGISYDTQSTYQRVLIGLRNTGTQLLHPTGSLQVFDPTGQQRKYIPVNLNTFLPQTSIEYPAYIQQRALHPGTYTAQLHLIYEGHHALNYETNFVVPLSRNTSHIGHFVSDLATFNPNFFSSLSLMDYLVGVLITFLVLSSLFFWSRQVFRSTRNFQKKENSRKK